MTTKSLPKKTLICSSRSGIPNSGIRNTQDVVVEGLDLGALVEIQYVFHREHVEAEQILAAA